MVGCRQRATVRTGVHDDEAAREDRSVRLARLRVGQQRIASQPAHGPHGVDAHQRQFMRRQAHERRQQAAVVGRIAGDDGEGVGRRERRQHGAGHGHQRIAGEDEVSGLPADILGFSDRGYLKKGHHADMVVLDPARYIDTATYDKPHQYARGAVAVVVNGAVAVENGKATGVLAGRPLVHQGSKSAP